MIIWHLVLNQNRLLVFEETTLFTTRMCSCSVKTKTIFRIGNYSSHQGWILAHTAGGSHREGLSITLNKSARRKEAGSEVRELSYFFTSVLMYKSPSVGTRMQPRSNTHWISIADQRNLIYNLMRKIDTKSLFSIQIR